jgi:hypothetical protein
MSVLTGSVDDDGGGRCGVDVGDGAADALCSTPLSNPSHQSPPTFALKGLSHEMNNFL